MNYLNYLRFVIWRAFQGAVVLPASFVAVIVLMTAMTVASPVNEITSALYQWADIAVRPAPPGNVLVPDCKHSAPSLDQSPFAPIVKPVACDPTHTKAVSTAIAAQQTSEEVSKLFKFAYLVLVVLSFIYLWISGRLWMPFPRSIAESEATDAVIPRS